MRFQKAQTTTELVILLSILFLLIGIIASPFIDIGQVAFTIHQQSENLYWQNTDIQILSHGFVQSNFTLALRNQLQQPVVVHSIHLFTQEYLLGEVLLFPKQTQLVHIQPEFTAVEYEFDVKITYSIHPHTQNTTIVGRLPLSG